MGRLRFAPPIFAPSASLSRPEQIALGFYLIISAWLVVRLWVFHRGDPFLKKFLWSIVLLLPVIGWVFYGAWYTSPSKNIVTAPTNRDAFYGGPGA